MDELPIFILDLHWICNLNCTYCITSSQRTGDFGNIIKPYALNKIRLFFKNHGPFNILISGGEPLITPDLFKIINDFVNNGHKVSIQTNLLTGSENLIKNVNSLDIGWILVTIHSAALSKLKFILNGIIKLKNNGFHIVVKILLDEKMLGNYIPIYNYLLINRIGVFLSPLIILGEKINKVKEYSPSAYFDISKRISLLSSWLSFSGGWKSKGGRCKAGSKIFYADLHNGKISGCTEKIPSNLGNIYENKFFPRLDDYECINEFCLCDFHYYTGIIPSLNDTLGFKNLLMGNIYRIPFYLFDEWLTSARVKPLIELAPWVMESHRNIRYSKNT